MSNPPPRKAMSGLGSVRRDWSESSMAPVRSSQEIPWEPTPPKAPVAPLTGAQKRLAAIQAALMSTASNTPPAPLKDSLAPNRVKRPSLDSEADGPARKRRQLPPSFAAKDPLSSTSGFGNHSIASSSRQTSARPPSSSGGIAASSGKVAAVFLSAEQTQILKLVENGDSVFYTGSAGTGKSVLLREIIKVLRKKYSKSRDSIAITASTGIAACNIGGTTVHSFAGCGLAKEPVDQLVAKVKKNKKSMDRWLRTRVLIIDEVSMVEPALFDKLAQIGMTIRKSSVPFGGIQVIVTGDFFQLPPVQSTQFAFDATHWNDTIKHNFNLTKVFRQKDQRFVDMLNEMRFGTLSQRSIQEFKKLARPLEFDDGLECTELFSTRNEVERANNKRMNLLNTEEMTFPALDGGRLTDPAQRGKALDSVMAPPRLVLRVDAQVMLIKNADESLVNGTLGKVIRFMTLDQYTNSDEHLGPPITIGGGTTNAAPTAKSKASAQRYPLVEFMLNNRQRRRVLVLPEVWKVESATGEVTASRTQLPLILSWAMSIHKSQGQTLERVKVDLGSTFEKGQAYVALSRATSLEGLQVLNFEASKVQAHPKVVAWSRTLSTITDSST